MLCFMKLADPRAVASNEPCATATALYQLAHRVSTFLDVIETLINLCEGQSYQFIPFMRLNDR
jgi:hypothetical protein